MDTNEYNSSEETLRRVAFIVWQGKERRGIPSTQDENWEDAKKIMNYKSPSIQRVLRNKED